MTRKNFPAGLCQNDAGNLNFISVHSKTRKTCLIDENLLKPE